jgi:GNAT superfamily N-acetyltransferase
MEEISLQQNNEKFQVSVNETESSVDFTINNNDQIASALQCEIDRTKNILIAQILRTEQDFRRQGMAKQLFIEAIKFAETHELQFVTDYGISIEVEKLIQSLEKEGFTFTKNENAQQRDTSLGTRVVAPDGSPVYILNKKL